MRIAVFHNQIAELGGGEKFGLRFVEPLLGLHDIDIFGRLDGLDPRHLRERLGITVKGAQFVNCPYPWVVSAKTPKYDVFINNTFGSVIPNAAGVGILLVYFPMPLDDFDCSGWVRLDQAVLRAQLAILKILSVWNSEVMMRSYSDYSHENGPWAAACRLPLFVMRRAMALRSVGRYHLGRPGLNTYREIFAVSEFSAKWVQRNYRRNAHVLYPPIDVDEFIPGPKEPMVLAVGRLYPDPGSKKHHILLSLFKELYDEGTLSGWRMCIAGGSNGSAASEGYIDRLHRESAGYPVDIRINTSFAELRGLYGRASLYWHGMGYKEDRQEPWFSEHFGMTTVEAMAAGCVAMVINRGGQPEIVTSGQDGFLWNTLDEFRSCVTAFQKMEKAQVARMRYMARMRARQFGKLRFYERAYEVFERLGIPYRRVEGAVPSDPTASTGSLVR